MKHISTLIICILLLLGVNSSAQVQNDKGEYLYVAPSFSPPEQELLNSLINSKAMNFMSKDLDGTDYLLTKYADKNVLILFWDVDDSCSGSIIEALGNLHPYQGFEVLAISNEDKMNTVADLGDNLLKFPVLTNGRFIGQLGYGESLGSPRLFFLGYNNQIKEVLPPSYLCSAVNVEVVIKEYLRRIYGI